MSKKQEKKTEAKTIIVEDPVVLVRVVNNFNDATDNNRFIAAGPNTFYRTNKSRADMLVEAGYAEYEKEVDVTVANNTIDSNVDSNSNDENEAPKTIDDSNEDSNSNDENEDSKTTDDSNEDPNSNDENEDSKTTDDSNENPNE